MRYMQTFSSNYSTVEVKLELYATCTVLMSTLSCATEIQECIAAK